jgi:hypothetical protein
MDKRLIGAGNLLLGAGLMYLLDPGTGRRRRALIRDKFVRAAGAASDAAGVAGRDIRNRAHGVVAQTKSLFIREQPSDALLEERVRSKLGRLVSHPGSIEVSAHDGRITLSGPVLAWEAGGLVSGVSRIRGVHGVEDRLEIHEQPGDVPGLQGQPSRPAHRFEFLQRNWSPAARLAAGTAGAGLAWYGLRRRDGLGAGLAAAGASLLARGVSNRPLTGFLGDGRKPPSAGSPAEWRDAGPSVGGEPGLEGGRDAGEADSRAGSQGQEAG